MQHRMADCGWLYKERASCLVCLPSVCCCYAAQTCCLAFRGICICGTGIGISIAANKVKGIRAALCGDCFSADMARRHNDANILALGARTLGSGLALRIVDTFLETEFEGGRHARRVGLIHEIETR